MLKRIVSTVQTVYEALAFLRHLRSCGKQKVSFKIRVEDHLVGKFGPVLGQIYRNLCIDEEETTDEEKGFVERLLLPNRPLLRLNTNESRLILSTTTIPGRAITPSPSPNSSPETSRNSSLPKADIKRISYLRPTKDEQFISIGLLLNRTTLFSKLLSANGDLEKRLQIWQGANAESVPSSTVFADLHSDGKKLTVHVSGVN